MKTSTKLAISCCICFLGFTVSSQEKKIEGISKYYSYHATIYYHASDGLRSDDIYDVPILIARSQYTVTISPGTFDYPFLDFLDSVFAFSESKVSESLPPMPLWAVIIVYNGAIKIAEVLYSPFFIQTRINNQEIRGASEFSEFLLEYLPYRIVQALRSYGYDHLK